MARAAGIEPAFERRRERKRRTLAPPICQHDQTPARQAPILKRARCAVFPAAGAWGMPSQALYYRRAEGEVAPLLALRPGIEPGTAEVE